MPRQPLAEIFGFPADNQSPEAERYRRHRLCPFNNRVPNCTKDKANNPLGVCSIYEGDTPTITCPIRFRQDWLITDDAAAFFFAPGTTWTTLTEVRLPDQYGQSAGNIDVVLVAYNEQGHVVDFGALEVQGVYISGNVRRVFEQYMADPAAYLAADPTRQQDTPRPDYLSSSRKRLAPQLIYKGGILHHWRKKQAVALHRQFYATLPALPQVEAAQAEMAWLLYDLHYDPQQQRYRLQHEQTVYTEFLPALQKITVAEAGPLDQFMGHLQKKLDQQREGGQPPDAPTLTDVILT